LSATGFSPYIKPRKINVALAPEGLLAAKRNLEGMHQASGHDFSHSDKGFLLNLRLQPLPRKSAATHFRSSCEKIIMERFSSAASFGALHSRGNPYPPVTRSCAPSRQVRSNRNYFQDSGNNDQRQQRHHALRLQGAL
jgi:hypothetical protein